MNKLYVKNETNFKFCYKFLFWRIINFVCKTEKIQGKTEVNLIIISDYKIRQIAKQYKYDFKKEIDILSFSNDYKNLQNVIEYNMLGDIYISSKRINQQALEYHHSLKREWAYMFTHSLYHLLGYDHINNLQEANIMNKKIEAIMTKIKVGKND